MRETTIFVFLFLILGSSLTPRFVLAEEDSIVGTILISTDKLSYFTKESITIAGEVTDRKMPVMAIKIFDPDDKILGAYSVELDEINHFTKTIIADTPFYEKSGLYTIGAEYGKLKTETFFEIENGSTEVTDVISNDENSPIILPQVISFETDKKKYHDEDTIHVSGKVSTKSEQQVTIAIFDPYSVPVGIYLASVNPDLTFSVSFLARYNVNFKVEGTYSLTAQYGGPETKQNTEIEFFEKADANVSTTVPNISENTDQASSNSLLLSESDLERLATWYYLGESDELLVPLFSDLLKRELVNPDVDDRISKTTLNQWIQDTELQLGIMIDDLFKENISEEEFFMFVEGSLSDYINKSSEVPVISNTPDTEQTKNISKTDESEIKKSPKFNDEQTNTDVTQDTEDIIQDTASETENETVYFSSSANCEKETYENIIAYYNNPGPGLTQLCKYNDAIFNYDKTLQSDPKNVHALANKGAALASLGRYQEAISYYDEALEVDPDYLIALNNKGNALSSLGRYQEAISYYDKALEVIPQDPTVLNNKEKTSTFLTVYSTHETEPKTVLISEEPPVHTENIANEKTDKHDDIVTQFANVFSSIGASLLSLFGG
ncbi:MAG TPA: tetratricopeptide repeat protein [Nitrosopumilaceae archaeon]|nr:tetratricopeptide repeat protein [Nitrosopumilaceae archaeon]